MPAYATDDRAERIANLRALADYLDANPDVPLSKYTFEMSVCAEGDTDEEGIAEVDRVAALFGVEAQHEGTHHRAVLTIGQLSYTVHTVTEAGMDRHRDVIRLGNAALAEFAALDAEFADDAMSASERFDDDQAAEAYLDAADEERYALRDAYVNGDEHDYEDAMGGAV